MKIAIDVMGGDGGLEERLNGVINASEQIDAQFVLLGDKEHIEQELLIRNLNLDNFEIVHAPETIDGGDSPVKAVKSKKNSSMVMGLEGVRKSGYDAFISAGNTGALMVGSLLKVGRIKGIDRPAICSVYPTTKGMAVLVDAGANSDCRPSNLLEFALMGKIYAKDVIGIESPRVGLLNIGHEEGKGNALVKETYNLLKEYEDNFIGNIEARDISHGIADVIVCDGFTGNVVLKLTEGVAKFFSAELKNIFMTSLKTKLGALAVKDEMLSMKNKMDYKEYGGAPLLGVRGLVVKAHGSSDARAFMNAILYAHKAIENNVVQNITDSVKSIKGIGIDQDNSVEAKQQDGNGVEKLDD